MEDYFIMGDSGPRRRESTVTTPSDDKENSASYTSVCRESDAKVLGVSGQILKPTDGTADLSALSVGSQKENPGVSLNSKRLKDCNKPPLSRSNCEVNSNRINNPREQLNESSMHTIARRSKSDMNSNRINNPLEQLGESSMHTIVSQVTDLFSKISMDNTHLSSESGSQNTVKTSHDTLTSTHGGKKSTTRSNYKKLIDATMKELEEKHPLESPQNDPYYGENFSFDCSSSSTESFENLLECMNSKVIPVEIQCLAKNCKFCKEKNTPHHDEGHDHDGHHRKKHKDKYISNWEPIEKVIIDLRKQNEDSSRRITSHDGSDNTGKSNAIVEETPIKNNKGSRSGPSQKKMRMALAREPALKYVFLGVGIASINTNSGDSTFIFSENSPDVNIVEEKKRQSTQKTKLQMQEKGKRVLNKSRDKAESGSSLNSILCPLSEKIIKLSRKYMWRGIINLSKSCMVLESSFLMRLTSRFISDCLHEDPYDLEVLKTDESEVKTAVKQTTLCIRQIANTNININALSKSFKKKGDNSRETKGEFEAGIKTMAKLQEKLEKSMKRMDAANKSLTETIVYYTGKPKDLSKELKRRGGLF